MSLKLKTFNSPSPRFTAILSDRNPCDWATIVIFSEGIDNSKLPSPSALAPYVPPSTITLAKGTGFPSVETVPETVAFPFWAEAIEALRVIRKEKNQINK